MSKVLRPPALLQHDNQVTWSNLFGSSAALAIAHHPFTGLKVVIANDMNHAYQLQDELRVFTDVPVIHFPDWETLPYDQFSPHEDITSRRLSLLNQLTQCHNGILVIAAATLQQRLAPPEFIRQHSFVMQVGDTIDLSVFRKQLVDCGYHSTEQVWRHGEFCVRGAMIDVFPMGARAPLRIELFDDTVDSLRHFDVDSQLTTEKIEAITLLPAREFPLDEASVSDFRARWREQFPGNPADSPVYQRISEGLCIGGIEYYHPLFFNQTATLFDYFPTDYLTFHWKGLSDHVTQQWETVSARYEQRRYDTTRPLLEPHQLYLRDNDFFQAVKKKARIIIHDKASEQTSQHHFQCECVRNVEIRHDYKTPTKNLIDYSKAHPGKIIFVAESPGRADVLLDLLAGSTLKPIRAQDWSAALNSSSPSVMIIADLHRGFYCLDGRFSVVTERELFNAAIKQRKKQGEQSHDPNTIIKNLAELKVGDAVVHITHGVGRYLGLETIQTGDLTAEYVTLNYANDDKVYVPIFSLHLINRYTGADIDSAPLHRLGSQQWQKAKEKAEKRVHDIAAELLDIYSKRAASTGHAFSPNMSDFARFRAEFPFEETTDQTTAINQIIADMKAPISMDRLVCGDVGFGKTEVAMQASFIAANSGKQVAVLVPTTLLANQHHQNFCDRFANWPLNIAILSRLQTPSETKKTLAGLKDGTIDIVVGTHKLLQKTIEFKDLGLLVVDEEHRFGVKHKDQIKAIRANVDILTLTATPIPRTLNMALSGTRDLSIIATPPQKRLSVKTFVKEHNALLVKEAIDREIMRGGQVFFLHNDIDTMPIIKEKLQALCPQIAIATAHGQMREKELENVMADFYHQRYQLLISTTIIESGIDIPTANTLIIHRADRFGLAQLHQLRGRVGRSHHQAYAYLLTPEETGISRDAKKRLEAIAQLEELGVGFSLATQDLEIRGAGELLGDGQSGHMHEVGFTLYMEMLDQAVHALKHDQSATPNASLHAPEVPIDLGESALFPEDYIGDVNLRLTLYKRLAGLADELHIAEFKAEIIDRFGPLPTAVDNLLSIAQLKQLALKSGIDKIDLGKDFGRIRFANQSNVKPAELIKLIQSKPTDFQLKDGQTLRYKHRYKTVKERVTELSSLVDTIT